MIRPILALILACQSLVLLAAPPQSPPPIPDVLKSLKRAAYGGQTWGYSDPERKPILELISDDPLSEEQWLAIEALGVRNFNLRGKGFGDAALERLVRIDPTALFLNGIPEAITDAGIAHISKMKSLRGLAFDEFASHLVTTKSAAALENHPTLEFFVAPMSWIFDPETFGRVYGSCKKLRRTHLGHQAGCDANCESLAHHPSMEVISVAADPNGSLTDAGVRALATMPKLTSLSLQWARFSYDGGLEHLVQAPHLKTLNLNEVLVAEEDVNRLKAGLPGVAITYTPIRPEYRTELEVAEGMKRGKTALEKVAAVLAPVKPKISGDPATRGALLTLSPGTASLTDEQWTAVESLGIRSLALWGGAADEKGLARAARLDPVALQIVGQVTDAGLAHLAEMKSLRSLDLGNCGGATAASAAAVANHPALETLTPPNAWASDAVALAEVLANPRLEGIRLLQRQANDMACGLLARHPALERVTLQPNGMAGLTNAALTPLATLPKLTQLSLSFSRFTYDGGLEHLAKLPQLATLSLGNVVVSQEDVDRLKAALPKTKVAFSPMAAATREAWEKLVAPRETAGALQKLPESERAARLTELQKTDAAAFNAVQSELQWLRVR